MSHLKKNLSLYGLVMIAAGSCIGSGIFKAPSGIFKDLPHGGLVMIAWAIGGIISIFGALSLAELGGMFPQAGGVYVYLKKAYGKMTAFLYGWATLFIINTGALAALTLTFVDYLSLFVDMNTVQRNILSAGILLVLTFINIRGVKWSEIFTNIFTGLKLTAVILIVGLAFYYSADAPHETVYSINQETVPNHWMTGMLLAMVGIFYSFGGWHHVSYLSGEAKNAKRNIPLAMVIGVSIVTVAYILVNYAYMCFLPIEEIINSNAVAGDAVNVLFKEGGTIVSFMIMIAIFGSIGIYTMSAPRIYYSMANDGIFFKKLAKLNPKYNTPAFSMLFQTAWAIVLVLFFKSFQNVMVFVVFMDILFMMLAVSAVFVLRYKMPDLDRPIKTLAYPVVPALYILFTIVVILNTANHMRMESLIGLAILGIGLPFYLYFTRNKKE